jgi:trehalose 6-phosphate synthase
MYEEVNQCFARAALDEAGRDSTIWVHDYQLTRVPFHIRQTRPEARLLFFWHIPFPAPELYRTLPWREQVLRGMLACNVIGFHIPEYAQNFFEACADLLGLQARGGAIEYGDHTVRVMARPIGIDFRAIEREAQTPRIRERARSIGATARNQKFILGVERMDYSKGILERLEAMEHLLAHHPIWRGKICMVQIVTPSRGEVEAYRAKKREVDEAVGRINGRFSDESWIPIRYLHRSFTPAELVAYYCAADIALVTPLRDGLNLVAKEYIASRVDEDGVVILSEFAGVAYQLPEALLTNPYSVEDLASAIHRALLMPKAEQVDRMRPMRRRLRAEDIDWWARQFLG